MTSDPVSDSLRSGPDSGPNPSPNPGPDPVPFTVTTMVSRFIQSRKISRQDYQDLSERVLEDGAIDEEERLQINRLFDAIQDGMVKIIP